jgi:hypothetical protein
MTAPKLPETEPEFYAAIEKLTERQRDVFGQVCLNNDAGHPRRTLELLERLGLVVSCGQVLKSRLGAIVVKRYDFASIAAHMAWCRWAEKNAPADD